MLAGEPTPENSKVLGDTALQSTVLEAMGDAPRYRDWLTDLALAHLGDDPVELGSGLGDYADVWLRKGLPRITVTEADETRLAHLRSRFAGDDRVRVGHVDLEDPSPGEHSAFVSFNVLEHILDDVAALRAARTLLRPGGVVVSFAPAFPFAMSDFDRKIGHVRRYTVASMTRSLTAAGLEPVDVRYVNAPGLLAWWLGMRMLHMEPGSGPILTVWDNAVIPVVRRVERRVRMPFGQSVFSIARSPRA